MMMEIAKIDIRQKLTSACAQVEANCFNLESIGELKYNAECFGANKLSEACEKVLFGDRLPALLDQRGGSISRQSSVRKQIQFFENREKEASTSHSNRLAGKATEPDDVKLIIGGDKGTAEVHAQMQEEMMLAIREIVVQQELTTTCNRARENGFTPEAIRELQYNAERFWANELSEACKKVLLFGDRLPRLLNQRGGRAGADLGISPMGGYLLRVTRPK